jgi:hypothetical protein
MEFLKSLLTTPTGTLLIIFGMVLLLLAIVGVVKGKFSLDSRARLTGGALGLISLTFGVWLQTHTQEDGKPSTPPGAQTCRINPKPWRWTATGTLLIEVDSRLVGVINVGNHQSGFDFVCSPGDHKYRVHSDTMSVACTGAIVLETGTTTLDLVFSQTSPGPPDCSLAVTSNRRD